MLHKVKRITKCSIPVLLLLLFVACSEFDNPLQSVDSESKIDGLTEKCQPVYGELYPPITAQMLVDGPAPGYKYVIAAQHALDTETDSLIKSERCKRNGSKSVKINHVAKIEIERDCVPQDTVVTIVAPLGEALVADFYPHPLQFDSFVEITWDIKHYDFPDDFDFTSLVPLYVDDDGNATEMEHYWDHGWDKLIIRTDHFSRYIVATRNNN